MDTTECAEKMNQILDVAENNKLELHKMQGKLECCLTVMEIKDQKFNEALLLQKKEFKRDLKVLENEFTEALKNQDRKHESEVNELKDEMKQVRQNEVLVESEMKRMMAEFDNTCTQKISSVDTKIAMMEKAVEEAVPLLTEMRIKNQLLHCERYSLFPIPQVNTTGSIQEHQKEPWIYSFKVSEVKQKSEAKSVTSSKKFPVPGYDLEAYAQISFKEIDEFAINLTMKNKESPKENINLDIYPRIFIILRDKSGNEKLKNVIRTASKPFESEVLTSLDYTTTFKRSKAFDSLYFVEDTVSMDFYVETPSQARRVNSYDGTLYGMIDNYSGRRESEDDGLLLFHLSPYFYTHYKGYRVQAKIFLRGVHENERTGLKIGISFENGKHDSDLDSSFYHRTTITVFKPTNPDQKITKSTEKEDVEDSYYEMDIGSDEEIESLLVNDVLFYKVTVDML